MASAVPASGDAGRWAIESLGQELRNRSHPGRALEIGMHDLPDFVVVRASALRPDTHQPFSFPIHNGISPIPMPAATALRTRRLERTDMAILA